MALFYTVRWGIAHGIRVITMLRSGWSRSTETRTQDFMTFWVNQNWEDSGVPLAYFGVLLATHDDRRLRREIRRSREGEIRPATVARRGRRLAGLVDGALAGDVDRLAGAGDDGVRVVADGLGEALGADERWSASRSFPLCYWRAATLAVYGVLIEQPVVLRVTAYPEPDEAVVDLDGKSALATPYPRRPDVSGLLEVKRWMTRVLVESIEGLIGESERRCLAGGGVADRFLGEFVELPRLDV
jgi:hypothetical protein